MRRSIARVASGKLPIQYEGLFGGRLGLAADGSSLASFREAMERRAAFNDLHSVHDDCVPHPRVASRRPNRLGAPWSLHGYLLAKMRRNCTERGRAEDPSQLSVR